MLLDLIISLEEVLTLENGKPFTGKTKDKIILVNKEIL